MTARFNGSRARHTHGIRSVWWCRRGRTVLDGTGIAEPVRFDDQGFNDHGFYERVGSARGLRSAQDLRNSTRQKIRNARVRHLRR